MEGTSQYFQPAKTFDQLLEENGNTDTSDETKPSPPSQSRPVRWIDPTETPIAGALYHLWKQDKQPSSKAALKACLEFFETTLHEELTTKQQFRRARGQLRQAVARLAHKSPDYARALKLLYDLVRQDEIDQRETSKAWFVEDVLPTYQEILKLLEQHLDPEIWALIREKMVSCFDGDPPL